MARIKEIESTMTEGDPPRVRFPREFELAENGVDGVGSRSRVGSVSVEATRKLIIESTMPTLSDPERTRVRPN